MTWSSVLFSLLGTIAVTACLSYYYSNWRTQHLSLISVHILSWWLPALILTTLPIDITAAFYHSCTADLRLPSTCDQPPLYLDPFYLLVFWHFVYWSSQLLTWIVLPIMRSYSTAGDFTVWAKLKTALLEQLIQYISYLIIFITILCYLLGKGAVTMNFGYLKVLLITSCNTWGLFLVIIFLGYGLVEVPRSLWIAGNPSGSLNRAYFTLNQHHVERTDYEEKLIELNEAIARLKSKLPVNHPWQTHLITIERQSQVIRLPADVHHGRGTISTSSHVTGEVASSGDLTLGHLVRIHQSLKTTQQHYSRAQALYDEAVRQTLWMEDVLAAQQHHLSAFSRETCDGALSFLPPYRLHSFLNRVVHRVCWLYYCHLRFWLLRIFGVLLACFSLLMVWSECTLSIRSPQLSLVAVLINVLASKRNYLLLELASFFTLGYLAVAVFYSVFHLRIFNYYRLVGRHHSDAYSLLFCGALLCRLAPSLCLNFLGMAHLDSHLASTTIDLPNTAASAVNSNATQHQTVETTYTQFMGHLDVITFIADGFNLYFPLVVLLFCLLTYFRVGSRLLRWLGIPQHLLLIDNASGSGRRDTHRSEALSADCLAQDAAQDGKILLRQERLRISRQDRSERASVFSDAFPTRRKGIVYHIFHCFLSGESKMSVILLFLFTVSANSSRCTDRKIDRSLDRIHLLSTTEDHDYKQSQQVSNDRNTSPAYSIHYSTPVEYSEDDITREFNLTTY